MKREKASVSGDGTSNRKMIPLASVRFDDTSFCLPAQKDYNIGRDKTCRAALTPSGVVLLWKTDGSKGPEVIQSYTTALPLEPMDPEEVARFLA